MTLTNTQRAALVANAQWLYSWSDEIGYDQARPFPLLDKAALIRAFSAGQTISWDCSGFIVQTYYLTGANDPSGYHYTGDGNTETMLAHLPHYTNPINAHPGALVIFGADQPLADQHVCMVLEQGSNPMLVSHGGPGVKILTLNAEQAAHTGATCFLDVSSL